MGKKPSDDADFELLWHLVFVVVEVLLFVGFWHLFGALGIRGPARGRLAELAIIVLMVAIVLILTVLAWVWKRRDRESRRSRSRARRSLSRSGAKRKKASHE